MTKRLFAATLLCGVASTASAAVTARAASLADLARLRPAINVADQDRLRTVLTNRLQDSGLTLSDLVMGRPGFGGPALGRPDENAPDFLATAFNGFDEVPDDVLFVDPRSTTTREAVFLDGPELTYDPRSGELTVLAPVMLGPANVLGQRDTLLPTGIAVFFPGSQRVELAGAPDLTVFVQGGFPGIVRDSLFQQPRFERQSDAELLFARQEMGFPSEVRVDGPNHLGIGPGEPFGLAGEIVGIEASFPRLVVESIAGESFIAPRPKADPVTTADGVTIVSIPLAGLEEFPLVGALVDYEGGQDSFRFGIPGFSTRSSGFTFLATATVIPEPTTAGMLMLGLSAAFSRRKAGSL